MISLLSFFSSARSGPSAGSTVFSADVVAQFDVLSPRPQCRVRFVSRDRQQPCRYAGARFKPGRLLPDVKEDIAQHVFCQRFVMGYAQNESIHTHLVARKQSPHRQLIAACDSFEKGIVRY